MRRRVLRRHIWGYSVCLCPIKETPGLNELSSKGVVNMAGSSIADLLGDITRYMNDYYYTGKEN